MNAVRDRAAPGMPLDWGPNANRFKPLTHRDPARRAPMAVRRKVPVRNVQALRRRWFAIGSLATSAVFGIGYELAHLLGSLLS